MLRVRAHLLMLVSALVVSAACHHQPPVARPTTPPPTMPGGSNVANSRPAAPTPVPEPPPVPVEPAITGTPDVFGDKDVDAINRDSPLKPVFFALDSDELDDVARQTLTQDAQVLKQYSTWVVTVEGHCDERGTAEYNLALGERRALAAKT